ncbi:hypothetical protein B7486_15070 [cyanobacterium TDX16]|nr:hypothetical protein B7486_15070 [cyanobacterium TDX16]
MNHIAKPSKAHDFSAHDLRRAQLASILICTACVVLLGARHLRAPLRSPGAHNTLVAKGIDPNTAHWFELSQLPGIGESLARRIIEFRARGESDPAVSGPIFRLAADLDPISGMGEKTIRRLQPFLRLPDTGN